MGVSSIPHFDLYFVSMNDIIFLLSNLSFHMGYRKLPLVCTRFYQTMVMEVLTGFFVVLVFKFTFSSFSVYSTWMRVLQCLLKLEALWGEVRCGLSVDGRV